MRIIAPLFLILFFNLNLLAEERVEKLRLLMVGNSFSHNATQYLPGLAEAAGKEVVVRRATLGGCSLQRHAEGISKFEGDPQGKEGRIYPARALYLKKGESNKSLKEALELEPWDYVTIQQASKLSFEEQSYEPYAGQLVSYIHRHAPTAKVLVHQTWAYREDHALFKASPLTPEEMYKGLSAAYVKLARTYAAEIVPVGLAFHTARRTSRWHFSYPDPNFDYTRPAAGALPKQAGSLNVGWEWRNVKGKEMFSLDAIHANDEGRYLAACVFFEVLFRESAVGNSFVPPGITSQDARLLQEIAHVAVEQFRANPEVILAGDIVLPKSVQGELLQVSRQQQPAAR